MAEMVLIVAALPVLAVVAAPIWLPVVLILRGRK